jgi:hypothetical protein
MQSPLCELFPVQMRAIEQAVRETVRSCHNGLVISDDVALPLENAFFCGSPAMPTHPRTHAPTRTQAATNLAMVASHRSNVMR